MSKGVEISGNKEDSEEDYKDINADNNNNDSNNMPSLQQGTSRMGYLFALGWR
jgi:hypothetical protein